MRWLRTINDDEGTVLSGPEVAMLQAAVVAELSQDGEWYKGHVVYVAPTSTAPRSAACRSLPQLKTRSGERATEPCAVRSDLHNWDQCCRIHDPVGAFVLQATNRHSATAIGHIAGSRVYVNGESRNKEASGSHCRGRSLVRESAVDWVEEAGFEAIAAADADEAIRILESRDDIRVVFTDINIQGSIDGLRLAHAIRNRWPPIKLVVTSGRMLPAETNLPEGGRFVAKPYWPAQVASTFWELIA